MRSIWFEDIKMKKWQALGGDTKTDVLVVGGGMAGVLCSYMLREAGIDCMLVEADRVCGGVTGNTTAKITVQHGLICDELMKKFGKEKTRLYFEAQNDALENYKRLCADIDCDFEQKASFVYSKNSPQALECELEAYEKIGIRAEYIRELLLPVKTVGGVKISGQAQFDPIKFIAEISKDLNIFENTKVLEFTPRGVVTNRGKIDAKKTIVTTHFPIINKHGWYFLKMYQHRSYVLALSGAQDVKGMYVDCDNTGLSFRNHGEYLLLGGGGHRTGKQGGGWRELEMFAKKHYPDAKIVSRWAAQDCMTLDGVPYIGQYSCGMKNLYVATGFNKWGMTSSMVAATLLRDLVLEKHNKYTDVFSPSRSVLHKQLLCNLGEALLGWITPTSRRCPHLGCALKYNRAEHTWDCPCHGSRFEDNGKLIDNPATDDKKM